MRAFSSILPFTSRLELRRATCATNGAQGGGGGGEIKSEHAKSIKDTALDILQELPSSEVIRAGDWVDRVVQRGNFNSGSVWRVVGKIKENPESYGVKRESASGNRGYCMAGDVASADEVVTADKIREIAQEVLDEQSKGKFIKLAYWIAEVMRRIDVSSATLSRKYVYNTIYFGFMDTGKVERGDRGMYRKILVAQDEDGGDSDSEGDDVRGSGNFKGDDSDEWRERDYYSPFAVYLRDVLLECDGAKDVSGIRFGTDSENPDVIGLAVGDEKDSVRYIELVTAEVKPVCDAVGVLMRGFEQACAYTRFSHKVYYLVVPKTIDWWTSRHEARLTDLCHGLGIGLVVADPNKNPDELPFTLLTRARRRDPVMSELNRYLRNLRENGGGAKAGRLAEFGFREDLE